MSVTFQYKKKEVIVEAFQWTKEFVDALEGTNTIIAPVWLMVAIAKSRITQSATAPEVNYVQTNTGAATLNYDDWIVRNPTTGEIYPCSNADFVQGFNKVEEPK